MYKPTEVAIDGPGAVGKNAIGILLAKKLGYRFVDTGAMYRALTWQAIQRGIDLNDEEVAKKEDVYNEKATYKPFTVCVGQKDVVKGLDEALEGKEVGKRFTVELQPEEAFGKKNPKYMQLVKASKFKEQNMQPYPGIGILFPSRCF